MSAQQPRAYNYVTNEDYSANASHQEFPGGTAPSQNPSQFPQYQQEQQHYTWTNDHEPPQMHYQAPPDQHFTVNPQPPVPGHKPSVVPPVNTASHPPPVNAASHPPAVNAGDKPHGDAHYNANKPPPPVPTQPYGDPQQQWGHQSFDEKFQPQTQTSKPKWNDVSP
jgi:hypothetical protein